MTASATESCTPNRHHVEPTHDFTVRSDLPYAWPDSNPASTRRCQMRGSWSMRAPNMSIRWPPVILVYSPKSLATSPIAMRPSGVTSPPAMRGTTEYEPSFCRFAITWSLVSCRAARSPSSTCAGDVVDRIEATVGRQMSQPRPSARVPNRSMTFENDETPLTRTASYSCARDRAKCSQRAVPTAMPCAASSVPTSFLTSGRHEPQLVPALVHALTAPRSVHAWSVTAPRIVPAETLLHEHTAASSGSSSSGAPPPPSGSRYAAGSPGSSRPSIGRRLAYALASPTRTPPSSVRASSDVTSFL